MPIYTEKTVNIQKRRTDVDVILKVSQCKIKSIPIFAPMLLQKVKYELEDLGI